MIFGIGIIMYHYGFYPFIARGKPDSIKVKRIGITDEFLFKCFRCFMVWEFIKVKNQKIGIFP